MRTKDFSFAVQLANTMEWNMSESDFEFMTKLEPDGCFVLFQAEEPIGIATCISYGKTGWFGNLAVTKEHREKGAGTFLVKHAINHLRRKGVKTVGLYAYRHLIGFYEKIDFKPHDDFVVLNGKPIPSKPQKMLKKASKNDILALVDFDKRCFGWNRKKLLKSILLQEDSLCYFSFEKDEIKGSIAAKVYEKMAEVGPLMCRDEYVALELIKTMLSSMRSFNVYVCAPENRKGLISALRAAGLKTNFLVTRMFLGPVTPQSCIYLPESLERG